ncbi:unnamed protein product [Parajaminaea phylloscopi]
MRKELHAVCRARDAVGAMQRRRGQLETALEPLGHGRVGVCLGRPQVSSTLLGQDGFIRTSAAHPTGPASFRLFPKHKSIAVLSSMASRSTSRHVLVVGGSGFLGSAISKRLLAQGHSVTSISPSGRPFLTPSGHRPAWSSSPSMRWAAADAFDPSSLRAVLDGQPGGKLPPVNAVVSTIGVLLEGNYKGPAASFSETLSALAKGWGVGSDNPLSSKQGEGMYERMNRDAAVSVARTWLPHLSEETSVRPPPFVFISAEDIFRPIIDARYVLTKRQAECALETLSWTEPRGEETTSPDADGAGLAEEIASDSNARRMFRPVFIRPGVMYHPHTRPLSTLPSTILDLSSTVHSLLPSGAPTPAALLKLAQRDSLARLLTLSPLHVDTVAKAVGRAIEEDDVSGVVDTQRIKALAGWKNVGVASPFAEGTSDGTIHL